MRASVLAALWVLIPAVAYPAIPEVAVIRCPGDGIQPVAMADPQGGVHLVFFKGEAAHGDLFYSNRPPGEKKFTKPVKINSTEGAAIAIGTIRGAQMALGSEGNIHVAWMGSAKTRPEDDHHKTPMLYSRSTDGGKTFETQRNLITKAYGLDGGGAIAADASGRVEVFWHSGKPDSGEAGRRIWVTRSTDHGKSFSPEVAVSDESTGVCGCCGMTAGASDGQSVVLYRSATEKVHRDIYALQSDGATREFESIRLDQWETPSCPMSSMSLAFRDEKTVAAWETASGGVAFKILGTECDGIVPHLGVKRKFPSIAIAPDGHVLMAWVDGAGWKKGGRLAWQLFSPDGKAIGVPLSAQSSAVWTKPSAIYSGNSFLIIH